MRLLRYCLTAAPACFCCLRCNRQGSTGLSWPHITTRKCESLYAIAVRGATMVDGLCAQVKI